MKNTVNTSETNAHTPGPWAVDDYGAGQRIVAKGRRGFRGDYRVADAYFSDTLADCPRAPEMQANARLIAAAPQLLEAAKELVAKYPLDSDLTKLQVAIAYAEGWAE